MMNTSSRTPKIVVADITRGPQRERAFNSGSPPGGILDRVLDDLAGINLRFFHLLMEGYADLPQPEQSLSSSVLGLMREMQPTALARAAQCRFALFDLAFGDFNYWSRRLDSESSRTPMCDARLSVFATAALFFAWHLIGVSEANSLGYPRLLLGIDPRIARRIGELKLSRVADLGATAGELVRPRWPGHRRFWPDLLQSASGESPGDLLSAKLMGQQLMAAGALMAGRETERKSESRSALPTA